jgi:hypothetical protein
MIAALACLSLLLFAVVVSQPLFFWMALGRATRGLSASAYAELRQQINASIMGRLTGTYVSTLLVLLALVAVALWKARFGLAAGAGASALGLIGDAVLATKLNVPLNKRMDAWSVGNVPADWESLRDAWDRAFAVRRVVLLGSFVVLVLSLSLA